MDGTDAKLNGLAPGDVVVSVNKTPVNDTKEAKKKLFGPVEEAVDIVLMHENSKRVVLVKREAFAKPAN